MNKSLAYIPLFIGAALAIGFYLGSRQTPISSLLQESNPKSGKLSDQLKLMQIMDLVEEVYVDSVDEKKLVEQTIEQMLTSLDPHSAYLPYEVNMLEEEQLRGNFAGVGVKFMLLKDTLVVTNVIKDGPSYRAGLKNGDRIIKIDKENIASTGIGTDEIMKKLKGKLNTTVKVTIKRKNELLDKIIVRGTIPIPSLSASFMLQPTVGYIKLNQFSATSYQEFLYASNELLNKGMKHLVFDLRGNGGGYLDIAHQIIDEFLEEGKLIVYTKDRTGEKDKYFSTRRGILKNIELSVLIDSESASASEIVAGAIQDNDRGTIYGRRSFGKGLVQRPITLSDSSQVRITVARYYTPTGRCIQKPYSGKYHEYLMELYDRDQNGELFALDSSIYVDSLKYTTPAGKAVYGGGGITPDVFIPYDTSGFSSFYRQLSYTRVFSEFTIQYLDKNREKWNKNSLNYFVQNFTVTEDLFRSFLNYAKEQNFTFSPQEAQHSKERIKERIKEDIASNIWDDNGRLYVYTRKDNDIQTILKNK